MHRIIPRPPPESLPIEVEHDTEETPQRDQRHVRHDRGHKAAFDDPRRDEFGKPITPDVLVDGDGDHQGTSDRLVRVDGVCVRHRRKSSDLDTSTSVADDHDCFPWPPAVAGSQYLTSWVTPSHHLLLLVSKSHNKVTQYHDQNIRNCRAYQHSTTHLNGCAQHTHGRQTHLWLTDALVLPRRPSTDIIGQWPSGGQAYESTDQDGEIEETYLLRVVLIRGSREVLGLREIDGQERAAGPGHNERREFDDREGEELPRNPQIHQDGLERMRVGLKQLPLLLTWATLSKPRIPFGGSLLAEMSHGWIWRLHILDIAGRRYFLVRLRWR